MSRLHRFYFGILRVWGLFGVLAFRVRVLVVLGK